MMNKAGLYFVCLVTLIAMSSSVVVAKDIQINFAQKPGIPLVYSSVTVERAEGRKVDGGYRITGLLYVPHRLRMAGHLHVTAYDDKGVITSESKHRVPGLNSARTGFKKIPFNVLVSGLMESTSRILVEHHRSGHKES